MLTQALVDTIAARIAVAEAQRPDLLATGRGATHPDVVAWDRQLTALRTQLTQLVGAQASQTILAQAVSRAIDARLASVIVQRLLMELERPAGHPDLQALARIEAMLRQRRAELLGTTIGGRPTKP